MRDYLTRLWAVLLGRPTSLETWLEDSLKSVDKALGFTDATTRYPHDRLTRIKDTLTRLAHMNAAYVKACNTIADLRLDLDEQVRKVTEERDIYKHIANRSSRKGEQT